MSQNRANAAYRVDALEQLGVEVAAAVAAAEVLLEGGHVHGLRLLLDVVVVLVDVEHDDGVGEREGGVLAGEGRRAARGRVGGAPVAREVLEHGGDEGRLARQPEGLEEEAERLVDAQRAQVEGVDEAAQVGGVGALAQEVADGLCQELFVNNHYLNLYSNLQHYYIIDI